MSRVFLSLIFPVLCAVASAQTVQFFTPNTVRIVKEKVAGVEEKSVVVIAKPEKVKVTKKSLGKATIYKSSALTVKVEEGRVTFFDAKGNLLTSEGDAVFTARTSGSDQDAYKVKQSFSVEEGEGIYGVGLLQNGKMSPRGENRHMTQSNLEDFAHFYQSIKGYGIYWENYSPTHLTTPEEGKKGEIVLESEVGKKVD